MSNILALLKSNLLIIISAVVALAAVALVFTFVGGKQTQLQAALQQRAAEESTIRGHVDRAVTIPSDDPNQPRTQINLTVNESAVAALEQVFQRMNSSYATLVKQAVDFNRFGPPDDQGQPLNPHNPMIEGLFPAEPSDTILFRAPLAYLAEFTRLYQLVGAGPAPTLEEINQRLATARAEYLALHPGTGEQDPLLQSNAAQTHLSYLAERARQIQVYGNPVVTGDPNARNTSIFHVEDWASSSTKPRMGQLWEAQMQIWLQQDVVQAIRTANASGGSVLANPVKRIIQISLDPASYVGLDVTLAEDPANPPDLESTVDQPLPENFGLSPTGRQTNPLYDVRMVYLTLIVDARQLPQLMNAFGRVNYMTPIVQKITRVDQQQHARQGYLYGDKVDVVQLDLQIETIWMRRWTAGHWNQNAAVQLGETFDPGLMPDVVRYFLGLPVRSSQGFDPLLITTDDVTPKTGQRGSVRTPGAGREVVDTDFVPDMIGR